MISRCGSVELEAVLTYLIISERSPFKKLNTFIKGGELNWNEKISLPMSNNAGFFPADSVNLSRFSQHFLEDIKQIDVLGSWLHGERAIAEYCPDMQTIPIGDIEPYYHESPWSESLKDKKVLVISPFSKSIEHQYRMNRTRIFQNPGVLPEFHLQTLQAIQSIANNGDSGRFSNWFEAMEWMCREIRKRDFDVAIIGAGAYGLPLAAYVKKSGKKAVHLGGPTQILFGIKGKRWDEMPFFRNLYNEYWIRPMSEETPRNFGRVESGCYW